MRHSWPQASPKMMIERCQADAGAITQVECGGSTPFLPGGSTAVWAPRRAPSRATESSVEPPHFKMWFKDVPSEFDLRDPKTSSPGTARSTSHGAACNEGGTSEIAIC